MLPATGRAGVSVTHLIIGPDGVSRGTACVSAAVLFGTMVGIAHAQCTPSWLPPPLSRSLIGVGEFTVFQGDLVGTVALSTGGVPVQHVARWSSAGWEPFGTVLSPGGIGPLAVHEGDLVAGGTFIAFNGQPANHIVKWNGAAWMPLGTGLSAFTSGAGVLQEFQGDLIAAGGFDHAGGQPASRVARWDGSSWWPMGSGITSAFLDPIVFAMAVYQDSLFVAGRFTTAGGVGAQSIARWDGTQWYSVGGGLGFGDPMPVLALTVYRGTLYAGGDFGWTFGPPWGLARWDGGPSWSAPAGWQSGVVYSLGIFRNELIIGGAYLEAGGLTDQHLLRWDESAWSDFPGGVNDTVSAFQLHDSALYMSGEFTTVGGLSSPNWARWGCPCYADCNNSGVLTIADFGCFQTQFVKGDFYADCNSDNALTIADFGCFQTKFVAGCP